MNYAMVKTGYDKTVNHYFSMPEKVMRNGVWIDIKENNQKVFSSRKK